MTDAARHPRPTTPRISVLLTSYNREDFIAASIESVLAQTVTDLELVICDDRSSDGTADIVRDYVRRDSRIRFSVNARNLGDYSNRRQVARNARQSSRHAAPSKSAARNRHVSSRNMG